MNKLFTRIFLLSTIIFVSFSLDRKEEKITNFKKEAIECSPTSLSENEKLHYLTDLEPSHLPRVRKNVFDLKEKEINLIRGAIEKMQTTMVSIDGTIMSVWDVQIKTHNGGGGTNPVWGTCEHESDFFLAWHRAFLYFFEKTMWKHMSGIESKKPGLPYWDYQKSGQNIIPPTFNDNSYSVVINGTTDIKPNPLKEIDRNGTMFPRGSLSDYINKQLTKVQNNYTDFYSFQHGLEYVHGTVHRQIGGKMRLANSAANDPLFWIHHANIDRLWQKWLNKGEGRCDPNHTDSEWWNKKYTFYYGKTKVSLYGKDIIELKKKINPGLHYKYDDVPYPPLNPTTRNPSTSLSAAKKNVIKTFVDDIMIGSSGARVGGSVNNQQRKVVPPPKSLPNQQNQYDSIKWKNIYLEFKGIKIIKDAPGFIEVYIDNTDRKGYKLGDNNFAGILDLFTAQAIEMHKNHNEVSDRAIKLDITEMLNNLKFTKRDLENLRIIFINKGNNYDAEDNPSKLVISIAQINVVELLR